MSSPSLQSPTRPIQPTSALNFAAALGFCLLPHLTLAQTTSGDGTTVVYPADYFNEWAPITAQHMLDRIPGQGSGGGSRGGPPSGVPGNPTSGGRGLGSGDSGLEIMINGKRMAGKNNQTSSQLERIAADQVREIQIIRGTSGDLDVRGSGQVVNIVLFEELASSNLSYGINLQHFPNDESKAGGTAALSGQARGFDYLFSFNSNPRYRVMTNVEKSILADFAPNDRVVEKRIVDQTSNQFSMNLGYELTANSSVRFNGLYAENDNPSDVRRRTLDVRVSPNVLTLEREDIPSEQDNWEVGGDYEYRLGNGNRFKLLAIANQNNKSFVRERFKDLDRGVPVAPEDQKNFYIGSDSITEERIIRGSYTMDVFNGQNIEFGVERAQTTLDSKLAVGIAIPGGTPSAAVGGLVQQSISNANSSVEEIRYEPFLIHNWTLNSQMSLESTIVYETSEISQKGDVSNKRDFDFIKPKFDLRYDITPTLQVRGSIERIVSQLSFSDFVAANDAEDNDAPTQLGNAQLRQQTQWKYAINTEYRLPNDVGVLSAEVYYADHQDVIDRMDVTTDENNLRSANGNIGDGSEIAMTLNASVRMGMIGLPNVLVTSNFNLQDSEVTDPFLGVDRRFQNYQRGRFTLTFRHDLPQWRANWGMQYFDRVDGGMFRYDVDDIEFNVGQPRVNLFVEKIDSRGLTWRLDAGALTNGTQKRRRTRYVGRIADNILEEIEYRETFTGLELTFRVTGTF